MRFNFHSININSEPVVIAESKQEHEITQGAALQDISIMPSNILLSATNGLQLKRYSKTINTLDSTSTPVNRSSSFSTGSRQLKLRPNKVLAQEQFQEFDLHMFRGEYISIIGQLHRTGNTCKMEDLSPAFNVGFLPVMFFLHTNIPLSIFELKSGSFFDTGLSNQYMLDPSPFKCTIENNNGKLNAKMLLTEIATGFNYKYRNLTGVSSDQLGSIQGTAYKIMDILAGHKSLQQLGAIYLRLKVKEEKGVALSIKENYMLDNIPEILFNWVVEILHQLNNLSVGVDGGLLWLDNSLIVEIQSLSEPVFMSSGRNHLGLQITTNINSVYDGENIVDAVNNINGMSSVPDMIRNYYHN